MRRSIFESRALGPASALAVLLLGSCVDAPRRRFVPTALDPHDVGVVLVTSDSVPLGGRIVSVTVRLVGASSAPPTIGSYTAQLSYDTLTLRYAGDLSITDGAVRAVNPTSGRVRTAGYAIDGISGQQLFGALFEVRRDGPAALHDVQIQFTELHSSTHEDLRPRLRALGLTTEQRVQP